MGDKTRLDMTSADLAQLGDAKWAERCRKLIGAASPKRHSRMVVYAESAQAWLEAAQLEAAKIAGGRCGPFEMATLGSAARKLAWARALDDEAHDDVAALEKGSGVPTDVQRKIEVAGRLADSARIDLRDVRETALQSARARSLEHGQDPLGPVLEQGGVGGTGTPGEGGGG